MPRLIAILMLAMLATAMLDNARGEHPTYQRTRGGWYGSYRTPAPEGSYERSGQQHFGDSPSHYSRGGRSSQVPQAQYHASQFAGGSFTRPYPYHLDYYRMRWGGSYAPYFGNIYGPPDVVLGAPYYGGGYYYGNQPAVPYEYEVPTYTPAPLP